MGCVAVIADDLTGACDAAVKLACDKTEVRVFCGVPDLSRAGGLPRVAAFHTDSRAVSARCAYDRVYSIADRLKTAGVKHFYKKIDSLFRGNAAVEICAVMDCLGIDLAVVSPAAPQSGRKFIGGNVLRDNAAAVPVFELFKGCGRQTAHIPLAVVKKGADEIWQAVENARREGAQIVLADAESEKDLTRTARACEKLGCEFLPVGALGFIEKLRGYWGLGEAVPRDLREAVLRRRAVNLRANLRGKRSLTAAERRAPACRGTFFRAGPEKKRLRLTRGKTTFYHARQYTEGLGVPLFVIGTGNPVTAKQVKALIRENIPAVFIDTAVCQNGGAAREAARAVREAGQLMGKNPPALLLAVSSAADPCEDFGKAGEVSCPSITDAVSGAAGEILRGFNFSGVVLSGGDTARAALDACGVSEIKLLGEALSGVSFGEADLWGREKRYIVTKSGGFGDENALLEIQKLLS
ncbi:MAG: four-carbon acid sugar kinase family protein [Oscillospiraceae bacterium]|nr:four-carbon acid sugar kinase family protein [Oscillospiraceae bacterium]